MSKIIECREQKVGEEFLDVFIDLREFGTNSRIHVLYDMGVGLITQEVLDGDEYSIYYHTWQVSYRQALRFLFIFETAEKYNALDMVAEHRSISNLYDIISALVAFARSAAN